MTNTIFKKQLLLPVRFRIRRKEDQKINFSNVNENNEKVQVPSYDMWKLP